MPITKTLRAQQYWEDFEEAFNEDFIPLLPSVVLEKKELMSSSDTFILKQSNKASFWKKWLIKFHLVKQGNG